MQADNKGLRYAEGKNRVDLIPPEWILGVGTVMTRGAIKYEVRNWERGMSWGSMVGSALRHIFSFICGERFDKETGCHHLAHAAWNCLALMSYDVRQIGINDLIGNQQWVDLTATEPGPELLARIASRTTNNGLANTTSHSTGRHEPEGVGQTTDAVPRRRVSQPARFSGSAKGWQLQASSAKDRQAVFGIGDNQAFRPLARAESAEGTRPKGRRYGMGRVG